MNMRLKPFLASLAMAGFGVLTATSALAQQASITLNNADAGLCYKHLNDWSLTKQVKSVASSGDGKATVTFTVMATKTPQTGVGSNVFSVHGGLTITNTGSAPATIGNIVINLQKSNTPKKGSNASYVSIGADVADAVSGDAATSANIVAAGSQENVATNVAWGTNNYTTSGAKGTFSETSASGSLEFKDASNNTVFSLVPQPVLGVGEKITLLYDANFNVAPPVGTALRVEALVTFGNSGARGGSGSSANDIDINGDGVVDSSTALQLGEQGANDADEHNVRTVPSRVSRSMPALEECNGSVTVTDPGVVTTGTVTSSNPVGFGVFPQVISDTLSWDVSVDVDGGLGGGTVTNTAFLDGTDDGGTLTVIVGYHEGIVGYDINGFPVLGLIPDYATYVCCKGVHLTASASEDIGPGSGFHDKDYFTYTQGAYGAPGVGTPDQLLLNEFVNVFGSGLTIGINDGVGPRHHALWLGTTAGLTAIRSYLPAGGPSGALTGDLTNASSLSGGTLAGQTTTLTLNLGFAAAGKMGALYTNLGALKLSNLVAGSQIKGWTLTAAQAAGLNGKSISDVLADANTALGGGGLPSYVGSFGDLNQLVTALNESFDNGTPSTFAQAYLAP